MRWLVACAPMAGPAMAEDWTPLEGEALRTALTARTLVEKGPVWPLTGAGRTWGFMADGRVLTDVPGRGDPV